MAPAAGETGPAFGGATRERTRIHQTKVDWWLGLLVGAGMAAPLVIGICVVASNSGPPQSWVTLLTPVLAWVAVGLVAYPTRYEISERELTIRSGLLRWKIPVCDIQGAQPTRNPLSAPAWSLDRVRIDHEKGGKTGFALVSPQDKSAFMRDLAAVDEDLELQEDSVVRRSRAT